MHYSKMLLSTKCKRKLTGGIFILRSYVNNFCNKTLGVFPVTFFASGGRHAAHYWGKLNLQVNMHEEFMKIVNIFMLSIGP